MLFNNRRSRFVIAGLVLTLALLPQAATAKGDSPDIRHPEGTLTLSNRQLVPGTAIEIGGRDFGARSALELVLVSVAGRFALGSVTADSVGGFTRSFDVPMDMNIGAYRIIAVAGDGDEVASLNVEMLAATAAGADDASDMSQDDDMAHSEPSADHMEVERAGSPWVTGSAVLSVIVALGVGVTLLRDQKHLG